MLSAPRPFDINQMPDLLATEIQSCLDQDIAFGNSQSFREEIGHACRILRDSRNPPLSYAMIGKLFGISKGAVRDHEQEWKAHAATIGLIGRPPILSPDRLDNVTEYIKHNYAQHRPVTLTELQSFILSQYQIQITRDTLRHILSNDSRIRPCPALPMDERRMEVTPEQILHYFEHLSDCLSGAPAHFVFNMDEMGHQYWADPKKRRVSNQPIANSIT
jgi:hypothetical protein